MSPLTSFVLLDLALLSLWSTQQPLLWNSILAIAVSIALATHALTWVGGAILLLAAASTYIYYRRPPGPINPLLAGVVMTVVMLGLLAHVFPGFKEFTLYASQVLSPGAYPTSLYWSMDKPIAGLLLVGWGMDRIRSFEEWKRIMPVTLGIYAACAGLILLLALPMGLIRWAPKPASLSGVFALTNFLYVAIPEEAFFRGFLQTKLAIRLGGKPYAARWSLVIAAVIFGVCHFKGGLGLILMATVAGLFYGYAYQRTGRLEASILVHGLLNTTHFALFTYPLLRFK